MNFALERRILFDAYLSPTGCVSCPTHHKSSDIAVAAQNIFYNNTDGGNYINTDQF